MQDLNAKKILCVEDDPFLSEAIAHKLKSQGATQLLAKTGEEALEILSKQLPDLILLDILLPGMSGFDVLKKIKENPKTADIPVILLTNLGAPADREKGKQLGASLFLVKAMMSLDEVLSEVRMVLDERSA